MSYFIEKLIISSFVHSAFEVAAHGSQKICLKFHAEKVCLNVWSVVDNPLGAGLRVEGCACLQKLLWVWCATYRFIQIHTNSYKIFRLENRLADLVDLA